MITLSPLPDELDRSYQGRLMRFNGVRSKKEFVELLAQWANAAGSSRREVSCLDLLCQAAHMDLAKFIRQHTTLPLRRAITSHLADQAHGTNDKSMLLLTGMRITRPGAYLCIDCAKSDLEKYGMSYWRRDHQLPGVFVCSKHLRPLRYVDKEEAFFESPSSHTKDSHLVDDAWARLHQRHPGVQRFLSITRALLERDKPIDVKLARLVLRDRAIARGLSTHNGKTSKPLLSDFVLSNFPRDWLLTIFPVLANKKPGEILNQMDGVLYLSTAASSVTPYILACCVLFESADDALHSLISQSTEVIKKRASKTSGSATTVELRSAYIANKGQHAKFLTNMHGSKWSNTSQLRSAGLPNLSLKGGRSGIGAVTAFLVHKQPLAESAALGKISVSELEDLIRQAGEYLKSALTEMNPPQRGSGTGVLRTKPMTPIEAIATVC